MKQDGVSFVSDSPVFSRQSVVADLALVNLAHRC